MANKLTVLRYTPPGTPDTAELGVTPSGNYVAGGDLMNLNPSAFTDPNGVGVLGEPLAVPKTPPAVDVENAAGYYAEIVIGATLAAFKLQWFQPGGAEVAAGAYPAQILAAVAKIRMPLR